MGDRATGVKGESLGVRTLLALAVTLVFWASAFAGIRAGLEAYTPGSLALLRFLVASAVMVGYATATRMPLPALKDVPLLFLVGCLGVSIYHTALNYGEVTVSAGAASLFIASGPVFTALLATTFLGERLRSWGWIGIGVSFSGVALVAMGEGGGFGFDPRALLVLLSAVSASFYFVAQKPLLAKYGPLPVAAYAIWGGTATLLVFSRGFVGTVVEAPLDATLAVVYLGVFPGAVAYVTWTYALSRAPASVVASFLNVLPVLAIFIAWVWRSEVPHLFSLAGGVLALAGVMLVNARGR